jgi:RNA polymerase sigma-70 factor (ECF subfamily)
MGDFATTQWSRVLTARDGSDSDAHRALETLCQTYWLPLYAFVRRQGHDPEAARDLTQAFFAELLARDFLKSVEPGLGRFRSFLLASLKNFLSHERDRVRALKRGGGTVTISLETSTVEAQFGGEQGTEQLTPEEIFERQWALTVLERALERVRQEARRAGNPGQFELLKPYLTGEAGRAPYSEVADRLGMSEGAVKAAVLRLRKRFGRALRAEIADTVADPAEVDDEIRRLLNVIRPWQG